MPDGVDRLANELADLRRRISDLETSRRAPRTSVQSGQTRWLDDDGEEAVAIGVDEAGGPFFRVWNSDASSPLFAVASFTSVFPQSTCAWQRIPTNCVSADGWAQIADGNGNVELWSAVLSFTTAVVRPVFRWRTTGSAVGEIELTADVRFHSVWRPGHDPAASPVVCKTWSSLSGAGVNNPCGDPIGTLIDENVTVPDSLWVPDADPAGTVAVIRLMGQVTSGTGDLEVAAVWPLHCWEV